MGPSALVWTLDTGDRRIDRSSRPPPPLPGWAFGGKAPQRLCDMMRGGPLSPPMSRDMISVNLTFQFVRLFTGKRGDAAAQGWAGLGPLRKAQGGAGQLSGQLDVMGLCFGEWGNPSFACDIGID